MSDQAAAPQEAEGENREYSDEDDAALAAATLRAKELKRKKPEADIKEERRDDVPDGHSSNEIKADRKSSSRKAKRRRLGDTGWVQVIMDTGVTYYIDDATKQSVWHCPSHIATWLEKHEEQKERAKLAKHAEKEARKVLSEDEIIHQYATITMEVIRSLKLPPIMTYDRAEAKLLLDSRFLDIPKEKREPVFERAKRLIIREASRMPDSEHTLTSAASLREQFAARVKLLHDEGKIRADHTTADIQELYFGDGKWLAVKKEADSMALLEQMLDQAREKLQAELSDMAPAFCEVVKRHFQPYVMRHRLPENDDEAASLMRQLFNDDDFVLSFLEPKNIRAYQEYLRDRLREDDARTYMAFAAKAQVELTEELIGDAWQMVCQEVWAVSPETAPPKAESSDSKSSEQAGKVGVAFLHQSEEAKDSAVLGEGYSSSDSEAD